MMHRPMSNIPFNPPNSKANPPSIINKKTYTCPILRLLRIRPLQSDLDRPAVRL